MDKLSRREVLRTGAVVAGAAWTAPVIRTASASQLLASGSPGPGGCTKPVTALANFNGSNPCVVTCVRPRTYWRTRSSFGPDPREAAWDARPENNPFFSSGKTNYQISQYQPPQSNPYYLLAPEWLAVRFNQTAGCWVPPLIAAAFTEAQTYFNKYTPAQVMSVFNAAIRVRMTFLTNLLKSYNNGFQGVGACSGQQGCSTAAIWFNAAASATIVGSPPSIVEVMVKNQQVTFTHSAVNYTINIPNTLLRYDPSASFASVLWDATFSRWVVRLKPADAANFNFGGGLMWPVPTPFPAGATNVTWAGDIEMPPEISQVCWKWAAAPYTAYAASPSGYNVAPVAGTFPAGTPQAHTTNLRPGATSTGGTNYTGTHTTQTCAACGS